MNLIILSLLSTIIFSILDNILFFILEITVQDKLEETKYIDRNMAELMMGGISSAISIFIASLVEKKINKSYQLRTNPYLDFFGIIIGTMIVIISYILYNYLRKQIKAYFKKYPDKSE